MQQRTKATTIVTHTVLFRNPKLCHSLRHSFACSSRSISIHLFRDCREAAGLQQLNTYTSELRSKLNGNQIHPEIFLSYYILKPSENASTTTTQKMTGRKVKSIALCIRTLILSLDIVAVIVAGELSRALTQDGMDKLILNTIIHAKKSNDDYPWSATIVYVICAWYAAEFFLIIIDLRKDKAIAFHHVVALLLTFCALNANGSLVASFVFFVSDAAALPMFIIDRRGHVGKTLLVALNHALFRIPFALFLAKILSHVFVSTTTTEESPAALKNPYYIGFCCLMVPMLVLYSLYCGYKIWKLTRNKLQEYQYIAQCQRETLRIRLCERQRQMERQNTLLSTLWRRIGNA